MRTVLLGVFFCMLLASSMAAWALASSGVGLSDDLRQNASLREGSPSGSRVIVGGGIHSGK